MPMPFRFAIINHPDYKDWGIATIESFSDNGQTLTCRWFKGIGEGWFPPEESIEVSRHYAIPVFTSNDPFHMVNQYVYWQDGEFWRTGRYIETAQRDIGNVLVVKPEGIPDETEEIPIHEAFVRWNNPVLSPIHLLTAQASRSPRLLDGRHNFLKRNLDYYKQYSGFTGIASSGAILYPHQLKVVYSVLTNPCPRFILADEVGLGKTVEVDIILRQWYLDSQFQRNIHEVGEIVEVSRRCPLRAVVVVPDHLCAQWKESLTQMAGLGHLVKGIGDLDEIANMKDYILLLSNDFEGSVYLDNLNPNTLVVDEAHMYSRALKEHSAHYEAFTYLQRWSSGEWTHQGEVFERRVLLLSATPVLEDKEGYFAMLHLLSPSKYPNTPESRTLFNTLFDQRDEIVNQINNVDPTGLATTQATLQQIEMASWSKDVQKEIQDCLSVLEDANQTNEDKQQYVSDLHDILISKFKLDNRIIRSTRSHPLVSPHLPSRERPSIKTYKSPKSYWAQSTIENILNMIEPTSDIEQSIMMDILIASITSPYTLLDILKSIQQTHPSFHPNNVAHALEMFPASNDIDPKVSLLRSLIHHNHFFHAVVMVSHEKDIQDILSAFSEDGFNFISIGNATNAADVTAFIELAPNFPGILIVPPEAEMGLNLEMVTAPIIHFDMPLNIGRIEQRLGRMDRIGRTEDINSVLLLPEQHNYFEHHWLQLIEETYNIFDGSIASYLTWMNNQTEQWLQQCIQNQTLDLSDDQVDLLNQQLHRYKRRVRRHERFNRNETLENLAEHLTTQMLTGEDETTDRDYIQVYRDLVANLNLNISCPLGTNNPIYEQDRKGIIIGAHSLIPVYMLNDYGHDALNQVQNSTHFCLARNNAKPMNTTPLRPGHPLVALFEQYMYRSDKGVASAQIRIYRDALGFEPGTYLRLSYITSLHPDPKLQTPEFLRLCANIFPDQMDTVWIRVTDGHILKPDTNYDDEDTFYALKDPYYSCPTDVDPTDRETIPEKPGYVDIHVRRERWNELTPVFNIDTTGLQTQLTDCNKTGTTWIETHRTQILQQHASHFKTHHKRLTVDQTLLQYIEMPEEDKKTHVAQLEHLLGTAEHPGIFNTDGTLNSDFLHSRLDHCKLVFLK